MLILILITSITGVFSNIATITTNISHPIDAVRLPNSSFLIADQNFIYLFNPSHPSIEALNLQITPPIINLALLSDSLAISTKQSIFLYHHNLTLKQKQALPALKEYSQIAFTELDNQIFYIPFAEDSLQFEQSKINSSFKRKFINQNNLGKIQYFEGHQFVLTADQIGGIVLYNVSMPTKIDSYSLCNNSSITRMLPTKNTSSMVVTCDNISFVVSSNQSKLIIFPIKQIGYSFALVYQEYLLMINSTSLLIDNKSNCFTKHIDYMTNIIHAQIVIQSKLIVYIFDDNGTISIVNISEEQRNQESNSMPVWQIAVVIIGGTISILIIGLTIKKRMKRRKKGKSYNSSEESQLSLKLVGNQQY